MMVILAIKDLVKNGKNQTKHYPAGIYLFKANFEDAGIMIMYEICSGWTIKTSERVKHEVKPYTGKTWEIFFSINVW